MPIPLDALLLVRTVIVHADCPDGISSALILRNALPTTPIRFVRHGTPEHLDQAAEPGLLYCDFSPPASRVAEFVAAGTIVLDHHRTARAVVDAFGPLGVFGDEVTEPGVCGAVLAYREVWRPLFGESVYVDRFATLAGIRDTWQRQDKRWEKACEQAEALLFWPLERWLHASPSDWHDMTDIGSTLLAKRAETVARSIRDGLRVTVAGRRVVILATTDTSDAMEALSGESDMVLGFAYRCEAGHPRMVVSLRGRGVDVGALAAAMGGGGHTSAAGFTRDVEAGEGEPWRWCQRWAAIMLDGVDAPATSP